MNSFLSTNQELRQGDTLVSVNKEFKAVFQTDSNFVIYKGTTATWASNTVDKCGYRILLQEDNNLVMYTNAEKAVWSSNSNSNDISVRMRLTMTDGGDLEIDRDGVKIWTSNKSK